MSQKELMAKIVQDAQRARQRAAAYIRSELELECLELPPVVRLGYNSDAGTMPVYLSTYLPINLPVNLSYAVLLCLRLTVLMAAVADHPQLYQVMTDVGLDFVVAMEASGTVGFIDLYKVMRKIEWGYGGAPAERRGTDKRGAIPPVSLSLGPLAELLLKMDARLHHCAYYDALMAARIATSLGYVMAAMLPPSNRSVVTHSRQMVGKVRWWRHVRAEWVAAATNTAWARWKATY